MKPENSGRKELRDRVKSAIAEIREDFAEQIEENMAKNTEAATEAINKGFSDHSLILRDYMKALNEKNRKDMVDPHEETGLLFAAAVYCLAEAKMLQARSYTNVHPAEIAERKWGADSRIVKALQAKDADKGGLLIDSELSSDFIDLLRAASVIESSGPARVPLDSGTITIPKLATGASGGWLGEGSNITKSEQTFGNVTLTARKYATLTPVSNDLMQYSSQDVERIVRNDLVRDAALAVDLAFLRGDGTGGQPRGLANLNGKNTFSANGTVNLANVTDDLVRMFQELMDDNVPMDSLYFFFAPRTWRYLASVLDSNGNRIFWDDLRAGELLGVPFKMTTQIPTNLGGGTGSEVYLVNMNQVIVGTANEVQVAVSAEAAYHDGSNVQASFSRDETVIRVIIKKDINARYDEAICLLDTVLWAA